VIAAGTEASGDCAARALVEAKTATRALPEPGSSAAKKSSRGDPANEGDSSARATPAKRAVHVLCESNSAASIAATRTALAGTCSNPGHETRLAAPPVFPFVRTAGGGSFASDAERFGRAHAAPKTHTIATLHHAAERLPRKKAARV
jgi:hypothetical protein